jgi:hypothetical protein
MDKEEKRKNLNTFLLVICAAGTLFCVARTTINARKLDTYFANMLMLNKHVGEVSDHSRSLEVEIEKLRKKLNE